MLYNLYQSHPSLDLHMVGLDDQTFAGLLLRHQTTFVLFDLFKIHFVKYSFKILRAIITNAIPSLD